MFSIASIPSLFELRFICRITKGSNLLTSLDAPLFVSLFDFTFRVLISWLYDYSPDASAEA